MYFDGEYTGFTFQVWHVILNRMHLRWHFIRSLPAIMKCLFHVATEMVAGQQRRRYSA